MAFNYDDKIVWKFGRDISPVLWIFIFLLYMTSTNLLPVKVRAPTAGIEAYPRLTKSF